MSNCPMPCLASKVPFFQNETLNTSTPFKVSVRPLPATDKILRTTSVFALHINQEVTVTESYIPDFSFSVFIADLGGSLGLWLGVGAVQIISNGVDFVNWITFCFK